MKFQKKVRLFEWQVQFSFEIFSFEKVISRENKIGFFPAKHNDFFKKNSNENLIFTRFFSFETSKSGISNEKMSDSSKVEVT